MNIHNTFLTFRQKDGGELRVSISDILNVGSPIDEDDGDDLELVSDEVEVENTIVMAGV